MGQFSHINIVGRWIRTYGIYIIKKSGEKVKIKMDILSLPLLISLYVIHIQYSLCQSHDF